MAKRLYVGGLPWASTDEDLKTAFGKFGTVASASVIIDKMTGRSKGFGFVEMSTDEEADAAIAGMQDNESAFGRKLTVNEARPMEARAPRREGGFSGGGSRNNNW